jgi:uncharacterized protein (DUF697 family)
LHIHKESTMHDIDRTVNEFGTGEMNTGEIGYEFETIKGGRSMWEQEYATEMNEYQGENFEFGAELPGEVFGEFEGEYQGEFQGESPLNEMQEMELAAELLSVTNEAELEQFLGGLIKKAARFVKNPVGRALGGVLKGIAKKALPVVGGALGSFVAPGVGTAIGSSLGSAAGKMFGLELEGLSNEDREFEVARRYVRMASAAARHAAGYPTNIPPHVAAKRAISTAARVHAPGLLSCPTCRPASPHTKGGGYGVQAPSYSESGQSGRWIRRGRKIVLFGV